MSKQYLEVGENSKVIINGNGSVTVKGWDEPAVEAKCSNDEDVAMEQSGDEIKINSRCELTVHVPAEAKVEIEHAGGEATIRNVEGEIKVGDIGGSLKLRNTGPVQIETVKGELSAKHVEGNFGADDVYGNLSARDIEGSFEVSGAVKGNLILEDVEGSASADVYGNASLRLDPSPGMKYEFDAKGNIVCRLPGDADVKIEVKRAAKVSIVLDAEGQESVRDFGNAPYERTLGEGEASLILEANGNVTVTNPISEWNMDDLGASIGVGFAGKAEEFAEQVSQQIESQMDMVSAQIEAQMDNLSATLSGAGLSEEEAERIAQRARDASSRAAARAQEKMRRTQEKLQHKIEEAQRRAEQKARAAERRAAGKDRRGWGFNFTIGNSPSTPPPPPPPVDEPVGEDERLIILRMLEEKKITMEEADRLLSALEGK